MIVKVMDSGSIGYSDESTRFTGRQLIKLKRKYCYLIFFVEFDTSPQFFNDNISIFVPQFAGVVVCYVVLARCYHLVCYLKTWAKSTCKVHLKWGLTFKIQLFLKNIANITINHHLLSLLRNTLINKLVIRSLVL